MTHKLVREYRSIIEGIGVEILGIEKGRHSHIKFRCKYRNKEFLYVCSSSPSDRRDRLNMRAGLRRIIQGVQ